MRYNIEVKPEALEELDKVQRDNPSAFKKFWNLVARLETDGLSLPQLVKVSGTASVWRLRFGRYRALLTQNDNLFTVWIIFLKTGPHREYDKWLNFISRRTEL